MTSTNKIELLHNSARINNNDSGISILDDYLTLTIQYLIDNWYKDNVGIVSCAIVDNEKIVLATSNRNGKYWTHAERNAFNKFKALHGIPSTNAIFITTLSPCMKELEDRAESSCSGLIKSIGVKRIHFGVPCVHSVFDYKES